ncbi:PREDICTED: transcription factor TGA1-like isoform X2 [Tarenaya hassleriana]|uniref:transcription factor TGA1-like isoform X2 n=1 Tax=Tarenaya hassleriana TaxID=28532 RepID=UPI00053C5369|nr:PREDICTED: transcription factor TGA1-like isoform X2 [Tarenaya hassleriana]
MTELPSILPALVFMICLVRFSVPAEGKMNTTSTHFVPPRRVGIYEPLHQIGMWGENFKGNGTLNTPCPIIVPPDPKLDNSEDTSHGTAGTPHRFDQEASTSRHTDKIQRRLAQNREAARKSRLRKKAYVQQLETSRLKLIQLEQELDRARQQGFSIGGGVDAASSLSFSGSMNPGIGAFEMEYGHWVEEQNRQICELRALLHGHASDIELRMLVDNVMKHYFELFRMKSAAAKADVFYVMSGMWKTSAERFFLWIGGFRPSELLKVLLPHLDVLTEQQLLDVCNLRQSCQQAEDALSQGMEKLQQTLAESVAAGQLGEGSYVPQMTSAMERLEALVSFVNQADHLRHETLQQMYRILTTRQAARGLMALGEYFQRLRALSSSWATRQREPA